MACQKPHPCSLSLASAQSLGSLSPVAPARRVPMQAMRSAALISSAFGTGNVTVGVLPGGDDTEVAVPTRRGAALPVGAQTRMLAPNTWQVDATLAFLFYPPFCLPAPNMRQADAPGSTAYRSLCGFARKRNECAYAPPKNCRRFRRACPHWCAAVESSADHGRRVCEFRFIGRLHRSACAVAINKQVLNYLKRLAEVAGWETFVTMD